MSERKCKKCGTALRYVDSLACEYGHAQGKGEEVSENLMRGYGTERDDARKELEEARALHCLCDGVIAEYRAERDAARQELEEAKAESLSWVRRSEAALAEAKALAAAAEEREAKLRGLLRLGRRLMDHPHTCSFDIDRFHDPGHGDETRYHLCNCIVSDIDAALAPEGEHDHD